MVKNRFPVNTHLGMTSQDGRELPVPRKDAELVTLWLRVGTRTALKRAAHILTKCCVSWEPVDVPMDDTFVRALDLYCQREKGSFRCEAERFFFECELPLRLAEMEASKGYTRLCVNVWGAALDVQEFINRGKLAREQVIDEMVNGKPCHPPYRGSGQG